jgi:hypothetical protein
VDGLKSFGRLLRRLRGKTPLETIGQAAALDPVYLDHLERTQVLVDLTMARHILQRGLGLPRGDANRLILGLQLYDLGLKDNELRQLVIAAIRKELPISTRTELKQLYRRYAAGTP